MSEPRFFMLSRDENSPSWNYVLHDDFYAISEENRRIVLRWCEDTLGPAKQGSWQVYCDIFSMHNYQNATAFKLRWL